ncbi:putative ribonuclease H-like domain-containing protein, partial [Tanacetum coccineum]
ASSDESTKWHRRMAHVNFKNINKLAKRRQQQTPPVVVENFNLEEPIVDQNIVAIADNRTMAQMLQAPIEGYEDAIVVPPINANNFELKQPLINLAITAVGTISEPLQLLHVDLFGPTSIRSIDHKYYSLVVTDDLSRFSWVFFLGTKDECNTPKIGSQRNVFPGALLHNTIAQVMRERPLSVV